MAGDRCVSIRVEAESHAQLCSFSKTVECSIQRVMENLLELLINDKDVRKKLSNLLRGVERGK